MTIRFLAYWNGYDAGAIATRADEAVLIAAGLAVNYVSPDPTNAIVGYVYLTDAQMAALSTGVLGVVYETPTGWFRWTGLAFVSTDSGGGSGATVFSQLTDATTADLPAVNAPLGAAISAKATLQAGALASSAGVAPNAAAVVTAVGAKADAAATTAALATKATLQVGALTSDAAVAPNAAAVLTAVAPPEVALTGSTAITVAHHDVPVRSSAAGTMTFAVRATSGATRSGTVAIFNASAGVLTAAGVITAPTGYKLTAQPGEWLIAAYDFTADAYTSATQTAGLLATTYATAIPLDLEGGREMGQQTIATNTTLTVAGSPAPVNNGSCNLTVVRNGTHTLDLSAFAVRGDTIANTAGQVYNIAFVQRPDAAYAFVTLGVLNDVVGPLLSSAIVDTANPDRIALTWNETVNATISAHTAFAVSAGHPLTSHVYVDATHSYLVTSTPFIHGEAARTLDYTQPGTNNMQDLVGNLTLNITAASITNNVADTTKPTLVSAIVSGANPDRIVLTHSEAINATLPSHTAYAVSAGHPLTAHTYFDATHSYLTTSTPFVGAETKTLAYAKPGTNNLMDLANNEADAFSGAAITDNVGAGSLGIAAFTPISGYETLTGNYTHYVVLNDQNNTTVKAKLGTDIASPLTIYGSAAGAGAQGGNCSLDWTDATSGTVSPAGNNGSTPNDGATFKLINGTTAEGGMSCVVSNIGTSARTIKVWARSQPDGAGNNGLTVRATLSDGAAPPVTLRQAHGTTSLGLRVGYTITAAAGSAGQTLLIEAYPDLVTGGLTTVAAIGVV